MLRCIHENRKRKKERDVFVKNIENMNLKPEKNGHFMQYGLVDLKIFPLKPGYAKK